MKKLTLGLMLCLLAGAAMAQTAVKYTVPEMAEKVKKLQTLEWRRIPYPFIYTEKKEWADNQSEINLFYAAKRMYEKHPDNFAAVYNYATLIMSEDYGEGMAIGWIQLDEAFRILEQAKKLRPDFLPVYEQQIYLLDFKLFGPSWIGPGMSDEEVVSTYRQNPDLARKQLALYQTVDQKWGLEEKGWGLWDCYYINLALNRTQAARAYRARIAEAERRETLAREREQKAAQEESERRLRQCLYQASWAGRY